MSTVASTDTMCCKIEQFFEYSEHEWESKYKAIVFYFNVGYFLCPILPSLELPVAAGDWKRRTGMKCSVKVSYWTQNTKNWQQSFECKPLKQVLDWFMHTCNTLYATAQVQLVEHKIMVLLNSFVRSEDEVFTHLCKLRRIVEWYCSCWRPAWRWYSGRLESR